jgi:xanthine dehydrogenase accessory factor
MREQLGELIRALEQDRPCVFCSVVETRGSSPQKAGAAMLVFADGAQSGTLGGGCVEAEVKRRALGVLNAGGPAEVMTFQLDDDYGWDDGLICGGRMSMLVDPIARSAPSEDYYRLYWNLIEEGKGCTEAVVLKDAPGASVSTRYLFDSEGALAARIGEGNGLAEVARHLLPLSRRPGPTTHAGIAYLPILPRITLLIVGAGHVGQAVARLAAEADFDIWVLDDRKSFASAERFPAARRLIVGDIGAHLKALAVDSVNPSMYCIIVTRGHNHDEEALYHLAPTTAGYVGMIGSRRKIKLIFEDLIVKGVAPEELDKVYAPLGLEIGSQTVMEIAVSIVAELIARRNLGNTRIAERVAVKPGNVRP